MRISVLASAGMSFLKNFFGGVTSLITGPKSLGNPEKVDDPDEIANKTAAQSAFQADVVRRNSLRTSSTAGTGADFIERMKNPVEDSSIPEFEKKEEAEEVISTAAMSAAELKDKYGSLGSRQILRKEYNMQRHNVPRGKGADNRAYTDFLGKRRTALAESRALSGGAS